MGAPVAGVSAGALIALEIAVLDANEAGEGGIRIEPGLDPVRGVVLGVHSGEPKVLPTVLESIIPT